MTLNWVDCPVCGESDMPVERTANGEDLIHCTNLSCPSNSDRSNVDAAYAKIDEVVFQKLLAEWPDRALILARIANLVASLRATQAKSADPVVLQPSEIEARVSPVQISTLAQTLASLLQAGIFTKFIQVKGQTYRSIIEIPLTLKDPDTGEDALVLLEDVHMFLQLSPAPQSL